jgi:radical SAM/Cys-rich protein
MHPLRTNRMVEAAVARTRQSVLDLPAPPFREALAARGAPPLQASSLEVLQLNVGKLCNQACLHCHVDAGPDRREQMGPDVIEAALALLDRAPSIHTVDITGGAPELHPAFRELVAACTSRGKRVIDRCNLTVLVNPSQRDLPAFLADHGVEVVASLPHPRANQTDRQRGEGVFERSISALRELNAHGYGDGDPRRRLVLVSNPVGAFLPAAQASLEREWKQELARRHGVQFDALLCLTNMPVGRFLDWLHGSGNLAPYLDALVAAMNPATVPGLMCRTQISVAWDGRVYDCDFNQVVELPPRDGELHVGDVDPARWSRRSIATAAHCYGCTAGAGSSCGGALA